VDSHIEQVLAQFSSLPLDEVQRSGQKSVSGSERMENLASHFLSLFLQHDSHGHDAARSCINHQSSLHCGSQSHPAFQSFGTK
jgi:hypothetical protein